MRWDRAVAKPLLAFLAPVLGLFLYAGASSAQVQICPLAPFADNSQNCASTKWTWTNVITGAATKIPLVSSTFTPNFSSGVNFEIDLVHASCPCTLANPNGILIPGQTGVIEVHQSSNGSDLIGTYGSEYQYVGGTASITLSAAASAVDYLPYYVNNAATGIVLGSILNAPSH